MDIPDEQSLIRRGLEKPFEKRPRSEAPPRDMASLPAVHLLWDELGAIPASRTDEALEHLMRWFRDQLGVDNVTWLGMVLMLDAEAAKQDPFRGWRLRTREKLVPDSENYLRLVEEYFDEEHYGRLTPAFYRKGGGPGADLHVGMASRAIVGEEGTFRAHRMRDGWIDYTKFRETDHYRLYYTEQEISDRIWLVFPVSATTESILLLDRLARGARKGMHFTEEEAEIASTVVRGLREFHRRLLLLHGVFRGTKGLSPLKRRILRELLSGKPEKEIAETLGQKATTLHKYMREIYAEFGVKTRLALIALWLGEA